MALRRLAEHQPETFAFSAENAAWCQEQMKKYPQGRQASAVIPILWRGQEQEGWVTKPMVEEVARMLGMAPVRVLEVATFYTMFNLHPVGDHLVQVCTTTPCWLRGSDDVVAACKKNIHPHQGTVSADGKFSWVEMECLGAGRAENGIHPRCHPPRRAAESGPAEQPPLVGARRRCHHAD